MATKCNSVDLRTFVTTAVAAVPARNRRKPEARYAVVQAAMAAATKGQVRRQDGQRYSDTTVRTQSYHLYNEIVG
jgi:hypothetical protein